MTASMEDDLALCPDGVMLSNGPGDPQACVKCHRGAQAVVRPRHSRSFGICLGHQLMALAQGFDTYKLKYGHRGDQPSGEGTRQPTVYISLPRTMALWSMRTRVDPTVADVSFVSMNDGSVEGLRYKNGRVFTVQFHPEASSGPLDTGVPV